MYGCESCIIKEALDKYPYEMVGYIKGGKFIPLKNISKTPKTRYQLSIEDKIFILDNNIDYLVHSHPSNNNNPSSLDIKAQKSTGLKFLIIGTNGTNCTPIKEII